MSTLLLLLVVAAVFNTYPQVI